MRWLQNLRYDIRKNPALLLMTLPVILYVVVFCYLPMSGIVLSLIHI